MRACFLGQNICSLGFGVALVQSPAVPDPAAVPQDEDARSINAQPARPNSRPNPMFRAMRLPHFS